MSDWIALANSAVGDGIMWFLIFVGIGLGAHLYGLNGRKRDK